MTREESLLNTKKVCEQNGIKYQARLPLKDLKKLAERFWRHYDELAPVPECVDELNALMGLGYSEEKAFKTALIRRMRATEKGLSPVFVN
jgi:hypothetical protein